MSLPGPPQAAHSNCPLAARLSPQGPLSASEAPNRPGTPRYPRSDTNRSSQGTLPRTSPAWGPRTSPRSRRIPPNSHSTPSAPTWLRPSATSATQQLLSAPLATSGKQPRPSPPLIGGTSRRSAGSRLLLAVSAVCQQAPPTAAVPLTAARRSAAARS